MMDSYVRYKQGTRAIVAWLVQHGSCGQRKSKNIPVRALRGLAAVVEERAIPMTDMIDYYFKQTIEERENLSEFFRRDSKNGLVDEDTCNHEYFTSTYVDPPTPHKQIRANVSLDRT